MTAESKTSVAARFVAFAFPSAADFGNLVDSYTDASDALEAVATAARTGSKGFVYVSGASAVSLYSGASVGLQVLNAGTTAAALGSVGGTTLGQAVFTAATTAAAQQAMGGGTVGRQVFESTATAAAQSLIGVASAATQAELEAASAESVYVSPEKLRHHPASPKVWAFISGGTTPEIKSSYNVATINRKAAGQYGIQFSLAMSNANYAIFATGRYDTAARIGHASSAAGNSAAGCFVRFVDTGGTDQDPTGFSVMVFGDH